MAATKTKTPAAANIFRKPANMPSKTTMNLAFHESSFHLGRTLAFVVVAMAVILVFTKIAILDQTDKKTAAYAALAEKQTQLQLVMTKLAGYDELAAQYGRYSYGWMTEEEAALVDRMQVLSIVENQIVPAATVQDFAINNNVLTLNISNITLEQTSALVNTLENTQLVSSVSVYTAQSDEQSQQAKVSMTIILEKEAEQE